MTVNTLHSCLETNKRVLKRHRRQNLRVWCSQTDQYWRNRPRGAGSRCRIQHRWNPADQQSVSARSLGQSPLSQLVGSHVAVSVALLNHPLPPLMNYRCTLITSLAGSVCKSARDPQPQTHLLRYEASSSSSTFPPAASRVHTTRWAHCVTAPILRVLVLEQLPSQNRSPSSSIIQTVPFDFFLTQKCWMTSARLKVCIWPHPPLLLCLHLLASPPSPSPRPSVLFWHFSLCLPSLRRVFSVSHLGVELFLSVCILGCFSRRVPKSEMQTNAHII